MGFWDGLGSALVGAGGSLLSGIMGTAAASDANQYNLEAVKQTNDTNLQINRENREFNRNLWYEQQDYNSPLNQMRRFTAAGLNPNLMYDKGDAGNAGTPPYNSAPRLEAPRSEAVALNLDNVIRSFLDTKNVIANVEKAEAQSEMAREQADFIKTRNRMANEMFWDTVLGNKWKTEGYRQNYLLTGERAAKQSIENDIARRFAREAADYRLKILQQQYKNLGLTGKGIELLNDLRQGQKALQVLDVNNYDLNHGNGVVKIGNFAFKPADLIRLGKKIFGF